MGHRKLPYGYTMQFGNIVLHPKESVCVQMIFEDYQHGASFNQLVEQLKLRGAPYSDEKLWNKNMVARILANERYTGQLSFPAIITQEQFNAVAVRRTAKQATTERSANYNALRKLCDSKVTPTLERQVLLLLNTLVAQPDLVQPQKESVSKNTEINALQKKLDEALAQQPVDEELAGQLISTLASAEYDSIGSSEYETQRIRHWLRTASPSEEINETLLLKCVNKVMRASKRTVCLKLKNGQIIERSATL